MARPKHLRPLHERTRIGDLAHWEQLFGYCLECGRRSPVDKAELLRKYGPGAQVHELRTRLKCLKCKSTVGNMFGVVNMDR